ncbi:hypothetical protein QJQ45_013096 [Haematococcus lacustris]|nr:hypothetical protein QJQ45_013096 [Haematococcus lacustris]
MPLIYSFVARDSTVLAEYTQYSGNFNTLAIQCLQNLNSPESKFTIACDRHTFNFLIHNGFTYLVVADEAYGRQIPFAFLERVRDEFDEKYADKGRASPAHSLDRAFGPRLKSHMDYCMAHPEEISKVAAVQKRVNEVKDVMVENIEKVLERGERIELLVDKADGLATQAEVFQKKGRQLRNKMWWQYCKMKLLIALIILVLIAVIFVIACFSSGRNCTRKDDGNFSSVAKDFLEKAGKNDGKFTYSVDAHTFNFLSRSGFTYLVVADEAYGRAIPSAFLDKMAAEFTAKYADKAAQAKEGSLSPSFGRQLKMMMEHATQFPEEYSKVASVQKRVDEVKGIMTENIEKMINRGEKLELLTDKTENLMFEADRFVRTGKTLRRQMWWQNCKMKLVMAFAVILLAVVVFLLVCFSGGNCLKR